MNILIADSGATKTSWASLLGNDVSIIQTQGLNPVLKVDSEIETIIFDELLPKIPSKDVNQLWFYGAGCKKWKNSERIYFLLKEAFPKSEIKVKTDIEGAGLALFGNEDGIIVISGTGSSAGFMHKGELVDIMPSKAYPEGDFGSGCHIGALVLSDYYSGDSPDFINEVIDSQRTLSHDELFIQFQNPEKSKQIAARVMQDIGSYSTSDYLKEKANHSFEMLIEQLIKHFGEGLEQFPVKVNGSTAFHFDEVFRMAFKHNGITINEIHQNPIQRLINYHSIKL